MNQTEEQLTSTKVSGACSPTKTAQIKIKTFGRKSGKEKDREEFDMKIVERLSLAGGNRLDSITINGTKHGGRGGDKTDEIELMDEDYFDRIQIRHGRVIDFFKIHAKSDVWLRAGNSGTGNWDELRGIRVLQIGGSTIRKGGTKTNKYVESLRVRYVEGYNPSQAIEENAGFILSYAPPGSKFFEYENTHIATVDSYEKVTESLLRQQYNASVEAEYYVKVSLAAELELSKTQLVSIRGELQKELSKGKSKETVIEQGQVGITLVSGTVMRQKIGGETTYWLYPTSIPSYTVISIEDFENVLDHYDLTGELHTQMPGLKEHEITKNDFVYYDGSRPY